MKEAIILAGGLGTRLRSSIGESPKPMAMVADKPFLQYILDYLSNYNFDKIVLAVGYKYEMIESHFGSSYKEMELVYSIEHERLGTGGAIKLALSECNSKNVLICNGDSFIDIDLNDFISKSNEGQFECVLALNKMYEIDRYGLVVIDENNKIESFQEKTYKDEALINSGLYYLNKSKFNNRTPEGNFSMETEYFEKYFSDGILGGFPYEAFFRDIGIPNDFNLAQDEFRKFKYQ